MGADADGSALVGLFQQFGGRQGALGPQRLVVLLAEAAHPLKGPDDQCNGGQLGFRVADLIFIQREGLQGGVTHTSWGIWEGPRHSALRDNEVPAALVATCDMNS